MNTEELYQQRLARYVTAMRNEKPDCVPIRPFVAEFTAKYAGFTCQEVAHDYTKAFEAAVKTAKDYGWDGLRSPAWPADPRRASLPVFASLGRRK